jgi:hypothetical protein
MKVLSEFDESRKFLECPHCHRHTIVQHGDSEYVCLNCNFRADVQGDSNSANGGFFAVMVGIGMILALALI